VHFPWGNLPSHFDLTQWFFRILLFGLEPVAETIRRNLPLKQSILIAIFVSKKIAATSTPSPTRSTITRKNSA
jgi:hypothetical protein